MNNWFSQSKQSDNINSDEYSIAGSTTSSSDELQVQIYRKPYRISLRCYVTIIFKSNNPLEYHCAGLATLVPQKKKGLMFLVPKTNSVKFVSYYPDVDGNYYVYLSRVPNDTFERAFYDQINSDDYDGTIDATDVNFWFDPLEIDIYNRLLARMKNNTNQYYNVLRDGTFQLRYSNYREDLT